jgi:hypothetical protein
MKGGITKNHTKRILPNLVKTDTKARRFMQAKKRTFDAGCHVRRDAATLF